MRLSYLLFCRYSSLSQLEITSSGTARDLDRLGQLTSSPGPLTPPGEHAPHVAVHGVGHLRQHEQHIGLHRLLAARLGHVRSLWYYYTREVRSMSVPVACEFVEDGPREG
jgi:hypothetical protein